MVFFHIESGAGVGCVKLKVSGSSEVNWKSTEEVGAGIAGSQEFTNPPGVSCRSLEKLNKRLLFL